MKQQHRLQAAADLGAGAGCVVRCAVHICVRRIRLLLHAALQARQRGACCGGKRRKADLTSCGVHALQAKKDLFVFEFSTFMVLQGVGRLNLALACRCIAQLNLSKPSSPDACSAVQSSTSCTVAGAHSEVGDGAP